METGLFYFAFVPGLLVLLLTAWFLWWPRETILEGAGRAVLISGCDSGIGLRLALYFRDLGCDVFAGCLDPSASTLPSRGVTVLSLDVTREESVREAAALVGRDLNERNGELWALVNNAGVCVYGEFEWQTEDQIRRQVEVNLLGTIRLTRACLPMLKRSKGRIVTITSVNGSIAYPGLSVYSATKFALEGLHHATRVELRRRHGVRVVLVQPGDLARLTGIMSRHGQNARDMWDAMPREERRASGDYFRAYHRVVRRNYGLTSPPTLDASPLLGDMRRAVLGRDPNPRYVSAEPHFRLAYLLLGLMPHRALDWLLDRITDRLLASDPGTDDDPCQNVGQTATVEAEGESKLAHHPDSE